MTTDAAVILSAAKDLMTIATSVLVDMA